MLKLILSKIRDFGQCRASRGRKPTLGRGRNSLPLKPFSFPPRPRFFAGAIFRISLREMRRQEVLPLPQPAHTRATIRNSL